MVKVTATREIQYAGVRVLAGETFDATEKDAKIFVAVKRATLVTEATPPSAMLAMRAPAAEPTAEPTEEAALEAPPHPRTYHRRDMVAEPPAGPTGPAKSPRSLRRGPARKAKT